MEHAALRQLTESYLDLRWHFDPVAASAAGLPAYDDRLGSFTTQAVGEHDAALRSVAAGLEELEVTSLDDEIDRTALLNEIRHTVHRHTAEQPHVRDPGCWLSHLFEGLYLPLASRDRPAAHRARAAAERLRAVPAFLREAGDTLHGCPRPLVTLAEQVVEGGIVLVDEIGRGLRPEDETGFDDVCRDAREALESFGVLLRSRYAPAAGDDFAIGVDAFNYRLRFQHAVNATATELLRYGVRLVEEVEAELTRQAHAMIPGQRWPDVLDRLRDDRPPGELVAAYRDQMERARSFVRERDLVQVPDGRLDVLPTPPYLRPLVPFAAYQPPGAFSADRTGWFYVSAPDHGTPEDRAASLREHCVHEIAATALHEGYPGHHLQFLSAQAHERLVRRLVNTPVTVEGWALYCEEMMGEQGFYRSPEERFFQQVALLWRALRVVLDVGLHTQSVTFEQAVEQLEQRVHFSRGHAEAEVRRYCAAPAYQLAYAVGRRELLSVRDAFQKATGGEYSLRRFHDAVLSYGCLPVTLIRWGMNLPE